MDISLQILTSEQAPEGGLWLDSLDLTQVSQQWNTAKSGRSVMDNPITMGGVVYPRGIGTHAVSEMMIDLKGAATHFAAMAGIDDATEGNGSVIFEVWLDEEKVLDTGVIRGGEEPRLISVDLTGASRLLLVVNDAGNGIGHAWANWAGAMLLLNPSATGQPVALDLKSDPAAPIASGTKPEPAIHGPRVVGTTPGRPFLFLIPATGEGPLTYSAENLPAGLALDAKTGIITGSVETAGEYVAAISVSGPRGSTGRKLKIVAGARKLAQTPPMGWNSWNVWASAVDDAKVRAAADAMVESGLAARGYQFINIDDCWEAGRDEHGNIRPNEKFPDMRALADYVHSRGLKLGIYSSPGPKTCADFEGSWAHEDQDARVWAEWGIDYLKHDWCSYWQVLKNDSLEEVQRPYRVMREALDKCGRDIVYSLCQYGMWDVWKWGEEVGANCWRTTGDISDHWHSMSGIGFNQNGLEKYAGPGHWNDPDMMVVGQVGWGPDLHPTRMTPNEQITHVTLWTLIASPILLGCDLSRLDQFTKDLLTNTEVIDVHQDPLGKAAGRKSQDGDLEVWARPLFDGTLAVGLFNRGRKRVSVTANWAELGIQGTHPVRDLWQQKDLGEFADRFSAEVPGHGAVLVKIGKPQPSDF